MSITLPNNVLARSNIWTLENASGLRLNTTRKEKADAALFEAMKTKSIKENTDPNLRHETKRDDHLDLCKAVEILQKLIEDAVVISKAEYEYPDIISFTFSDANETVLSFDASNIFSAVTFRAVDLVFNLKKAVVTLV